VVYQFRGSDRSGKNDLLARSVNSRRKSTHRQLLPLAVATGPTGPGVRFPLFLLLDAAPGHARRAIAELTARGDPASE